MKNEVTATAAVVIVTAARVCVCKREKGEVQSMF